MVLKVWWKMLSASADIEYPVFNARRHYQRAYGQSCNFLACEWAKNCLVTLKKPSMTRVVPAETLHTFQSWHLCAEAVWQQKFGKNVPCLAFHRTDGQILIYKICIDKIKKGLSNWYHDLWEYHQILPEIFEDYCIQAVEFQKILASSEKMVLRSLEESKRVLIDLENCNVKGIQMIWKDIWY